MVGKIAISTGRYYLFEPVYATIGKRKLKTGGVLTIDRGSVSVSARNASIADKDRTDFGVAALGWRRHFEIEHADAPALLTIVCATIA